MGLFGKPKKVKQDFHLDENLSLGEMAAEFVKQGVISVPKDNDHNAFGEELDKLRDGELPRGWSLANKDFIKSCDSKLVDLSVASSKAQSVDEEIRLLREFIKYYYACQEECAKRGECFTKYFSDTWMHCHNSQNEDFEFVYPREERLHYLEAHYDELIKKEKIIAEESVDLDSKILEKIRTNEGILQTELYKNYNAAMKSVISGRLYFLNKENVITREKSGSTCKLFIGK